MIPVTSRSGQSLAVYGLGASGRAAARALLAGGAQVVAWDDSAEARATAAGDDIPLAPPERIDWSRQAALVLSPGVPLSHPAPHPVAATAAAAGVAVIGDIELLAEARPAATLVGVTGTNGKSTTVELVRHVCERAGFPVRAGGNLGPPALDLDLPDAGGAIVLEVSSFQLELTQGAAFDIAVLLNVAPDHLDRHGDMDRYVAAKALVFRRPAPPRHQTAIIGTDDDRCAAIRVRLEGEGEREVVPLSIDHELDGGVSVVDGILTDLRDGSSCDLSAMKGLLGRHNWQNAAAAWAALRALGVDSGAIGGGFATFPGLRHRMETVAVIDGIRYVNDSKATNVAAAVRALTSFRDIYWIAGGVFKDAGLAALHPCLGAVRHAYLIGEAGPDMAGGLAGRVEGTVMGSLDEAVDAARRRAAEDGAREPVVLLSPACASFDQYRNFEDRGDHFRSLVLGGRGEAGS